MSDTDLQLLARYTRHHAEDAFTELVRRHLDLVFSAALRQVRSPQLAEEVVQSAFTDLARNAARLKPDTILTAWLYQVTRRTAIDVVRRESRRQLREQIATEMNAMNATADDWTQIEPLLEEAMHTLDETDRTAVLLRYFENKSLREVGETLGASEEAARKRISRAVDRLRGFFTKRGVSVGASGLVVVISANAVQAAPVGLAVTISTAAALAGTTIATTATATAAKAIVMTTLQKSIIGASLAIAVGTGIYEARKASQLREQNQTLQQRQAPLTEQVEQLTHDRDAAASKLALLREENEHLNRNTTELLKLRGEVTRLRAVEHELAQLKTPAEGVNDPFTQSVLALTARAAELNQQLERMPEKRIPELQFLSESDWLTAAKDASFQTDADIRRSLSKLRILAKSQFGLLASRALDKFIQENNGQLPDDPVQLKPYFAVPVDELTLQRYRMLHTGNVKDLPKDTIWMMSEQARVDQDYDSHLNIGPNGRYGQTLYGQG